MGRRIGNFICLTSLNSARPPTVQLIKLISARHYYCLSLRSPAAITELLRQSSQSCEGPLVTLAQKTDCLWQLCCGELSCHLWQNLKVTVSLISQILSTKRPAGARVREESGHLPITCCAGHCAGCLRYWETTACAVFLAPVSREDHWLMVAVIKGCHFCARI